MLFTETEEFYQITALAGVVLSAFPLFDVNFLQS